MVQLKVNEVFVSIQGESTYAGLPCVFVRLTGCDLRCTYCDTEYAFFEGRSRTVEDVVGEVLRSSIRLVEITGGEPLLQTGVHDLMRSLCDAERTVLLETSGARDVSGCDPRVIRIVDLKTPSSGEVEKNRWANLDELRPTDQIKFVIGGRDDFDWSVETVRRHELTAKCTVLFSPVWNVLPLETLAAWIRDDALPVRLQPQLHKILWGDRRGV